MEKTRHDEKAAQRFLSGVLSLSVANIIVKVLGLLFRVPIANILSDESLGAGVGMGYFSVAYTVYVWLFTVSTAGIPNGISILVSENRAAGKEAENRMILKRTLFVFGIIGAVLSLLLFFTSPLISDLLSNSGARLSMTAIAPTLFFVSVLSVLRGYFYGYMEMLPSAVSEVIEATGKLVFGIGGALYAKNAGYGAEGIAAFAIFGVTVGVFLGTVYLYIVYRIREKRGFFRLPGITDNAVSPRIVRRVLALSVPIMLSSSVMSLTGLIDLATAMPRLSALGYSESEASALYGTYTMLAVPIYHLPIIVINPIATALIPYLSRALADGDREGAHRITESTVRTVSLVVIPAALGLCAFSYPILSLLFAETSARVAAPMLSVLSAATFFLGILTVLNAVLQANRMAGKTVIAMLCGAVAKILSEFLLSGIPYIGIYSIPIGTVLCFLVAVLADTFFIVRGLGTVPDYLSATLRPFCAASGAVLSVKTLFLPIFLQVMPEKAATICAVLLVSLLYIILLLLFRAVTAEDIRRLPFGEKTLSFLKKYRLIEEKKNAGH